jgi:RNA polymerase sigma factor (sigma-70 family)
MAVDETLALLRRCHAGDRQALGEILERDLPWIRAQVEARLGAALRARVEGEDVVQQALLAALRHGPRFLVADQRQFRALLARIVENTLRKEHRFARQQRRDAGREEPLPSGSVVDLDAQATRPSLAATRSEHRALVQLALELLPPQDREVVWLRQWEQQSFAAIGERLGLSEDATRMRFQRALGALAHLVARIRRDGIGSVLG